MTPEHDPLDEDFPPTGRGRGCNLCVQKDAAIEVLRDDLAALKGKYAELSRDYGNLVAEMEIAALKRQSE